MTDSTEVNGRAKVCKRSEHRVTPGREAGVIPSRQIVQKNDKMQFGKL